MLTFRIIKIRIGRNEGVPMSVERYSSLVDLVECEPKTWLVILLRLLCVGRFHERIDSHY